MSAIENDDLRSRTDGKAVGTADLTKLKHDDEIVTLNAADADEYSNEHPKRGYCLIFNHYIFRSHLDMDKRHGTLCDRDRIDKLFNSLNFEVKVFNDLRLKDITNEIKKYAYDIDHTDCDCFVVFFMSHGDNGILYAYDATFSPDLLSCDFAASNCPSLASKPKMFFIQACRGEKVDPGANMMVRDATDFADILYTIPEQADFLICWSTVPGYVSYRHQKGSWFLQSLCDVFEEHSDTKDVTTMITLTNRRISILHKSYNLDEPDLHNKKQTVYCVTTLMRLIYLKPKI